MNRLEELIGDLVELRGRRRWWRLWWDVASICGREPRVHAGVLLGAAFAMGALLLRHPEGTRMRRTIRATDPAGWFTLEFEGRRVIAASLDGTPVARDRLIQTGGRLVIRGGAGGGRRDLNIRIRPDGAIYWQGRTRQ